ncbi:methionyl-tRNA formyltransferase [Novosphingobium decolorationis]|uniref:Methionyl-tRNA formyltransferase n=1 Tax=Novosphingobium decolorationis TaxID=2698673 RepID=A0ABX8E1V2_9SPHN|nr:formyltransferase family protein [Novosphingobium decolorationis]QVM83124.1 methionyl-tRNA formyltransferase [Novosphingobium decolorationis]
MGVRAVVVGAVGSTQVLLEELLGAPGWQVPLVLTLPPALHGRHSDLVDLAPLAGDLGARLEHAGQTNSAQTLAMVRAAEPDYVFVVGWSQIVGEEFLSIAASGTIGYHPAPLPRLRGRAAIPWTILLGEPISASSLFWIGEGTDDGDILAQKFFHVAPDATAQQLYDQHMDALRAMLRTCLAQLASGTAPRERQDARLATWAARRTPADGRIDWRADAARIDRLVRAVGRPYPGAFAMDGPHRLTVWSTRPCPDAWRYHALPGQVLGIEDGVLRVMTGSGPIDLVEWESARGAPPKLHGILEA